MTNYQNAIFQLRQAVDRLLGAAEGSRHIGGALEFGKTALADTEALEHSIHTGVFNTHTWEECEQISNHAKVDEAMRAFSEDPTGDNAICLVRDILTTAGRIAPPVWFLGCDTPPDPTPKLDWVDDDGVTQR